MSGQSRQKSRLNRIPSERHWVTFGVFFLIFVMLIMAVNDPRLWDKETFKDVFKALTFTGLVGMIMAFHFTANSADEEKTKNTGRALDAIKAAAESGGGAPVAPDFELHPGETAQAVADGGKADG